MRVEKENIEKVNVVWKLNETFSALVREAHLDSLKAQPTTLTYLPPVKYIWNLISSEFLKIYNVYSNQIPNSIVIMYNNDYFVHIVPSSSIVLLDRD